MLHIYLDSNVLLQCKALPELPWAQLAPDEAEIELIIPVAVQKEIDRLKQDGNSRRAQRSRKAAELFGRILDSDTQTVIVLTRPKRVTLSLGEGCSSHGQEEGQVAAAHGLDPSRADNAILLEMLAHRARAASSATVMLMTADTPMRVAGKRLAPGSVMNVPETWFLAPELDGRDRRVIDLEKHIAVLENSLPKVEIEFVAPDASQCSEITLEFVKYSLDSAAIAYLLDLAKRRAPMPSEGGLHSSVTAGIAAAMTAFSPNAAEIKRYRETIYPAWLHDMETGLHELADQLNQQPAIMRVDAIVRNVGHAPAEHVAIRFVPTTGLAVSRASDSSEEWSTGVPNVTLPGIPAAPQSFFATLGPRSYLGGNINARMVPTVNIAPRHPDRFYSREETRGRPPAALVFECEIFRHRIDDTKFGLIVDLPVASEIDGGRLNCQVSATNLRLPVEASIPIRIKRVQRSAFEIAKELVERATPA